MRTLTSLGTSGSSRTTPAGRLFVVVDVDAHDHWPGSIEDVVRSAYRSLERSGNLRAAICRENHMTLERTALYGNGVQEYVVT